MMIVGFEWCIGICGKVLVGWWIDEILLMNVNDEEKFDWRVVGMGFCLNRLRFVGGWRLNCCIVVRLILLMRLLWGDWFWKLD